MKPATARAGLTPTGHVAHQRQGANKDRLEEHQE
jgi:hypothetical protein